MYADLKNGSALDKPVTAEMVKDLFKMILQRPALDENYVQGIVKSGVSVRSYIGTLRSSDECLVRASKELRERTRNLLSAPSGYRAPRTFAVTPSDVNRVLVVGSCFMELLVHVIRTNDSSVEADVYLLGNPLPEQPERPIADYQFQIVQLALRSIIPDFAFGRLAQDDLAGHEKLFEHAKAAIDRLLAPAMQWNLTFGILTFVMAFPAPQQNLVGRLMPRYDLRNPVYFVDRLNQHLAEQLARYQRAYFVDVNEILASSGKRLASEDAITTFNHGSLVGDFDFAKDQGRLEPVEPVSKVYGTQVDEAILALWNEMLAMYRSVNQIDSVKMVVVDLDDTLWRGIVAETEPDQMPTTEGWPKSLWETLLFLKRRGILLAIISKNEESRVREMWPKFIPRNGIRLDDFAITRINWLQKSENMKEILQVVNLLPRNVVYIDDNPAQRADIQRAFPDIRVLGGTPSLWRHSLLWAPETQVLSITSESAARTAMIQAHVRREEERNALPAEEFLRSLDVSMPLFRITGVDHPRFDRVIELINKTNQFNTTGKRWSFEECKAAFAQGVRFYAFEVSDRFTDYGLVGVLIVDRNVIRQFVMSCRVMGLEAELAAVAYVCEQITGAGSDQILAAMECTERNLPCRDVYARSGFVEIDGTWQCSAIAAPRAPDHIAMVADPDLPAKPGLPN